MQPQSRVRFFRLLIISMVAVGIGCILISLVILTRDKFNAGLLEKNQIQVRSVERQFSKSVPMDEPVHKPQPESDKQRIADEEIDKAIAWLESLGQEDETRESARVEDEDTEEFVAFSSSFKAQELSFELTPKIEQYANLAEILPRVRAVRQSLDRLCKETHVYGELFRKVRGSERDEIDEILIQLDSDIQSKIAEKEAYHIQISDMFPALGLYEEDDDGYFFHVDRLVSYFGRELPWDGNRDYFEAELR